MQWHPVKALGESPGAGAPFDATLAPRPPTRQFIAMANKRVRQAITLGVDKKSFMETVTRGRGEVAAGNFMEPWISIAQKQGFRVIMESNSTRAEAASDDLDGPTLAALFRDSWIDYAVRILTIGGLSIPSFWFGMLIMLGLLYFFGWLPPITFTPIYVDPVANLTQLIWPALALVSDDRNGWPGLHQTSVEIPSAVPMASMNAGNRGALPTVAILGR